MIIAKRGSGIASRLKAVSIPGLIRVVPANQLLVLVDYVHSAKATARSCAHIITVIQDNLKRALSAINAG